MAIDFRYGDLLDTEAKYIAHCVNAQGVMNSGVAKAIRDTYPNAYEVYRNAYLARKKLVLGSVIGADCGDKIILNLVGQEFYGRQAGRVYLGYTALCAGISNINKNIKEPVAFPAIGCGLAGGDRALVFSIIEEEATNFQPIVYELNDEVPF